jgi:circadian clock protein KaiC
MSGTADEKDREIERVPSGVPGLDTVLRGGFLRGGVYILQGVPGAGKTVLANQIVHHHVAGGGRCLYVTLLAETHARMMLHLAQMPWFDQAAMPSALVYVSAFRILEEEGLRGLLGLLRREGEAQAASLMVLDGFVAAQAVAPSETEFKKFVHELQVQAGMTDRTILLLTSGHGDVVSPEHTMVDGVLELGDEAYGFRAERGLTVHKFRGTGFLRGRHPFRITDAGVVVYPRFEALHAQPSRSAEARQHRLSTGVEQLDAMLAGGIPEATTTAVIGPSGAGKTILGLHFVARASAAEPGLFFGFFETPSRLLAIAKGIGLDLEGGVERGHVELLWQAPTEDIMDALAHRLGEAVRRRGVRRLVVDGLGGFIETATQPDRITRFFAALSNELRALGVTAIYTLETRDVVGSTMQMPVNGISSLVENLIFLRYVEYHAEVRRVLSVLKVRTSAFDRKLREFEIDDRGIRLADTFESARKLLSGTAEEASAAPPAETRRAAPRGKK